MSTNPMVSCCQQGYLSAKIGEHPPDFNHFKIIRTPALRVCSVFTFSSVFYVWCSFILTTTLMAGINGPSAPILCRRKQKQGDEAI